MCKIKTGADVQYREDLQKLVTSMILRQPGIFTKKTIVAHVRQQTVGSRYERSPEIDEMVAETLNTLYTQKKVMHDGHGKYQLRAKQQVKRGNNG